MKIADEVGKRKLTKPDEYIRRNKAIAAINDYMISLEKGADVALACIESLEEQPAESVRPLIRSYWKRVGHTDTWKCENCGHEIYGYYDEPAQYTDAQFCSCCGATMGVWVGAKV